jgi:hypothetical protein
MFARAYPAGLVAMTSVLALPLGCEPSLVVGSWSCGDPSGSGAGGDGTGPSSESLVMPWSTGFENGFCDYVAAGGYCYVSPGGVFETVTSPVRTGKYAAAYSLTTVNTRFGGNQSRCVRGGKLPEAAYYSAHFFIPRAPSATVNWNLIHFRGQDDDDRTSHGLWDVSLSRESDGTLRAYAFDHLRGLIREATDVPPVPVGEWFELEVYWKRAADTTGEFAFYLNGDLALELTELTTDDSSLAEWYVGNLAVSLTPNDSTLYVDDVAIREEP